MRMVGRLGLAVAGMVSAPLVSFVKVQTADEAVSSILGRYSSHERITFVGYNDLGYKDPAVVDRAFADAVNHCTDGRCLVISGATPEGIGRVYDLARKARIEAVGIVSSRALEQPREFAVEGDHLFVIDDHEWGGEGSPTSGAMVRASTHMVGVGGGGVAAFEMMTFANTPTLWPVKSNRTPTFWPAKSTTVAGRGDGACDEQVMRNKELFDVRQCCST